MRRMGNDQHLNIAGQTSQAFADSLSGSTADTCINFIKIMVATLELCARLTFKASIKRASSPPEAILFRGPCGELGLVATVK